MWPDILRDVCFDILCLGVQNYHTHILREVVFNTYTPFNITRIESFLVRHHKFHIAKYVKYKCTKTADIILILFTDLPNQSKMQNLID